MYFGIVCERHLNEREFCQIIQRNGGHCVFENSLEGSLLKPSHLSSQDVQMEYNQVLGINIKSIKMDAENVINCWGDYFQG